MSAYWFIRTKTTYDPVVPALAVSQDQFNRDVSYALSALAGGYGVAGDLQYRASAKAIANFILCDGSELSRTAYPELFDAIGETFGAGDGSTTFAIPTQDDLATVIATPPAAPEQTVTDGTVGSGTTVATPTDPGQIGGTTGGQVPSGGREPRTRINEP